VGKPSREKKNKRLLEGHPRFPGEKPKKNYLKCEERSSNYAKKKNQERAKGKLQLAAQRDIGSRGEKDDSSFKGRVYLQGRLYRGRAGEKGKQRGGTKKQKLAGRKESPLRLQKKRVSLTMMSKKENRP